MAKTYLVTGGAGGIGSAICKTISKYDPSAKILIHYCTSKANAESLKKEIPNIEIIKADLESKSEIEKLCKHVLAQGRIFGLVNCAGFVEDKEFDDRTYEDFEKAFKVNLFAPFMLSQKLGREMHSNKGGKIVNISSTNGNNTTYPTSIDYDASKAALNSLTRNCAAALAPYVNVNAVAPGWVDVGAINEQLDAAFLSSEKEAILLKRFAKPEEIAEMVWFLLSDKSNYLTGAIIPVDGGIKIG